MVTELRRTAAATRHEETFEPDRVDTSRQESAGDGVTEFPGRCERRVKNIHCELVQLLGGAFLILRLVHGPRRPRQTKGLAGGETVVTKRRVTNAG